MIKILLLSSTSESNSTHFTWDKN